MRLLVTRPHPDAERTAAALRARGCEVILAALTRIEGLSPSFGHGPWRAVVLTSANAARAVEEHPRRAELVTLPVFVVGRRTQAAARAAGFAEVHSADGNANDLLRLIATGLDRGPLLYLAGEDRAADLAGALAGHGIAVETVVVYRAAGIPDLPPAAVSALDAGVEGVLHYSRRSAEIYLECARRAGLFEQALTPVHFCLSRAVADPLLAAGAADIRIAPQPQERVLLDLVAGTR